MLISISAVSADGNFTDLNNEIQNSENVKEIAQDYTFDEKSDANFKNGILINKNNITINGNGHVIDGNNQAMIFNITGENITISDLKFINSPQVIKYWGKGWDSQITLNNLIFENNLGIDGPVELIASNSTLNNCKFINSTSVTGTAIYAEGTIANINNMIFSNFNGNSSILYMSSDTQLFIDNCTFSDSTTFNGAVFGMVKEVSVKNSRFINLNSNRTGGAFLLKMVGKANFENNTFINISARRNGGAVYIDDSGKIEYKNCKFINCSAEFGGAILHLKSGETLINNTSFDGCCATFDGGAVYVSNSILNIENADFNSNKLSSEDYCNGGAIYSDLTNLTVRNSKFVNNMKHAIYSYDNNISISDSYFTNNGEAIHGVFINKANLNNNNYTEDLISLNNTNYVSLLEHEGSKIELINNTIVVDKLPSRFDLRDWGWVSPVRDQGPTGMCWTFGTCGALESALLKNTGTLYDFSENNMQNSMLKYSKYGDVKYEDGAFGTVGLMYILSWLGALPSEYDAYDAYGKISPIILTKDNIHIQDAIVLPARKNSTDNDAIKHAIIDYGSLIIGYASNLAPPIYNKNTSAQYGDEHECNHAVSLVGWDDNFSKSNFLITPPGDGAWIIKNSMGSEHGDKGYDYISYYDKSIMMENVIIGFVIGNTENYTKNYQTDIGGEFQIKNMNKTVSYKNTYTSVGNDLISGVGTYFNLTNEEYTVEIYVNDELKLTQNGTSPFSGFHTIKLNQEIPVKFADNFTAVITKQSIPLILYSRQHFEENRSFANYGNGWIDLASNKTTASIKVYTKDLKLYTEDLVKIYKNDSQFEAKIDISGGNVIFEINGQTYNRTSDKNGIAKININLNPGNYTIRTTFNGTTVENSITVLPTLMAENLVKYYKNASQFEISLIDGAGNPVSGVNITMNINGVLYNRTTNENGTAKLNINLNPKEYILTAVDPLTGLQMSYSITVLPILNATDMEMKYLDGSQFKAQLLDGQGKALAGETITFNVNGVFYNKTTDKNGIARLNIRLMAGEYIITSMYANGARIANKITITS